MHKLPFRTIILISIFQTIICSLTFSQVVIPNFGNESAPGAGDGYATLKLTGYQLPYEFTWTGPNNFYSQDQDIFNLSSGTYCLTLSDARCAIKTLCGEVGSCDNLNFMVSEINCPDQTDGNITLILKDQFPYTLTWSDGAVQSGIENQVIKRNNLPLDYYCVTVTNASGCTEVACENLFPIVPQLGLQVDLTNPGCESGLTGRAELQPIGGHAPYSYYWDDGMNTKVRSDLNPGMHCVSITDDLGCTISHCFEVNSPIEVVVTATIESTPSACSSSDGSINLLSVSATGGSSHMISYEWYDDQGTKVLLQSGNPYLDNLSSGQYCLIVTDDYGCTGQWCIELLADHAPLLIPEIMPSCNGVEVGSIYITALNPGGTGGDFNFNWSTGLIENGTIESTISEIGAGQYCVTVSSAENDCSITKCYNVNNLPPPISPLSFISSISHPCPDINNGEIQLSVFGGEIYNSPWNYKFNWQDILYGPEPIDRIGLASGLYEVTISDYCNNQIEASFDLQKLELSSVEVISGCKDMGSATALAINGNPSYNYKWSNGKGGSQATNLSSGEYVITITDTKGCTISQIVNVQNKEVYITMYSSCNSMMDGYLEFIANTPPNGGHVTINVNGTSVYDETSSTSVITSTLTGLASGSTYTVQATIDECSYTISGNSYQKEKQHVFLGYEEGQCLYQDYCNDQLIPGGMQKSEPELRPKVPWDNSHSCNLDIVCAGGYKVGSQPIPKRTVRAQAYEVILAQAFNAGVFSYEMLEKRAQDFYAEEFCDCENITFCPANLVITSSHRLLGICGQAVNLGGGCYHLRCGIWGTINASFCAEDIVPNELFQSLNSEYTYTGCDIVKINLYQLFIYDNFLSTHYPNEYPPSTLRAFVLEHGNDPNAPCFFVRFCRNNFQIISTENELYNTSCSDPGCDGEVEDCAPLAAETPPTTSIFACLSANYSSDVPSGCGNLPGYYQLISYTDPPIGFFGLTGISDDREHLSQVLDLNNIDLKIQPNPFSKEFSVKTISKKDTAIKISISDINGKLLLTECFSIKSNLVDIRKYLLNSPPGVYIVQMEDDNKNKLTKKLIKI